MEIKAWPQKEHINAGSAEKSDPQKEIMYYYSVRLLITHPTMSEGEVTAALGMELDYSWNAGERKFTNDMVWVYTSYTERKRQFFDEIHEVLEWLHEEQKVFISCFLASGGNLHVIIELPGIINIGDVLRFETMSLAVKLGVTIGVDVFPNLAKPMLDG